MKCKLCEILEKEKDKFIFEDENVVILPTKNMKGHKQRIMLVAKKHNKYTTKEKEYLNFFIDFCRNYFKEEPTFALVDSTYASIPGHWHRIACDWYGTEKEIKQLHYTPHEAIRTKVKWNPKEE